MILAVAIAFASCKKEAAAKAGDLPYFHFDRVDHYTKEITEAEVEQTYSEQEKSRKDQALLQIVTGNVPVNPADTLFIANMDILGFQKKTLDPGLNDELSKIFSKKEAPETSVVAACEPIYRDVLVFRQKGKVVGVAKICFDCGDSQIVGARYNPGEFGQSGEFSKLGKILDAK